MTYSKQFYIGTSYSDKTLEETINYKNDRVVSIVKLEEDKVLVVFDND